MASAQMAIILAEIASHPFIFNFNQNSLGEDVASIAAAAIREFMDSELDPDGARWPDLADSYADWKSAHYPGLPMGELLGLMKQSDHLIGALSIQGQEMHQLYGTSDEAQLESVWFQEGNPGVQPPRPFYAFNSLAIAELDAFFDWWFADKIK